MDGKIIAALKEIVGPEQVRVAPEELRCYSYDGTGRQYLPEAIAFPGSVAEVSAIMRLASATPFVVVPRGAGSGMTGGSLPVRGGLVLAMSRLNRILEIDEENQVAVVEPGVITGELRAAVKKKGLYYPPDPASLKFCTMGGNVAECAGGPSAVKYGVTRDYVRGLEVVLADGRILRTGVRTAKGVVGYDLTRLFVGSEGTLAIVTKIIVKLLPAPPEKRTFLVLCRSMGQATSLVSRILAHHLPCTLEYMDKAALHLVADRLPFPLPPEAAAFLLLEVDGEREVVEVQSRKLGEFLAAETGLLAVRAAGDEAEAEALWAARRAISPAAFQLKPDKLGEDVVVPRSRIPELVEYAAELAQTHGLPIFTFGHAGDGNIHVNIMLDQANRDEIERAETAKRLLFAKVLALAGTLSGEHGVGITKADYLALEVDAHGLAVMAGLKRFFDPQNILNPGKIFPPPENY